VAQQLEYLREALEEAEAAARWYAERSLTAAAAFSDDSTQRSRQSPGFQMPGLALPTTHAAICAAFRTLAAV
jgi:hypothetical protein